MFNLNAFCVDLEEWFHVCDVKNLYEDPSTWDKAETRVERNTEVLLKLLDIGGAKGTFLTVGWIAKKYPDLIKKISNLGHEIGCHGYYHKLIYKQSPREFREEISSSKKLLEDISGQAVVCFRAPGFSMKRECFWSYQILMEEGIRIDISLVPAVRAHGGVDGFIRNPLKLKVNGGEITVFPVSVMSLAGRTFPFSGGGYLRFFPLSLIKYGFKQNHTEGRPVMVYIHPREIDPEQPRLKLPVKKYFKYYIGLKSTESKLLHLIKRYPFGTVSEVISRSKYLPKYKLVDKDFILSG